MANDLYRQRYAGLYMDDTYFDHFPKGMRVTDGIPEELREVVNDHWDNYPPPNPLITHFVGVLFFFLTCICVFGNAIIIYVFLKVKSLRTPSNMFVINLAVSDFCMLGTNGPPLVVNAFMQRYWAYGVTFCKIYGFLGAITGSISICTMVAIGYDRYNVIVKGMNGVRITPGKAFAVLLVIWIYNIAISIPPLLNLWGSFATEGMLLTCTYDYLSDDWNNRSYMIFVVFGMCILPLILVVFFYSSIVKAVWSHEAALKKQAKKMNVDSLRSNAGDSNSESAEFRIAKVAITNVTIWVLTWLPYSFVTIAPMFGRADLVTPLVSQIPAFIAKTGSCLNPIIYSVSHPKYREALLVEVPCLGIGEQGAAPEGTTKETVKA